MALFQLIVLIIAIGVALWAVNTFVPMDSKVKQILNTVVIIVLVVWLLWWLLMLAGLGSTRVPMP